MKRVEWEKIGDCSRCGAPPEYEFKLKKSEFLTVWRIKRNFCKTCLLEVLDEQKIEKTKTPNAEMNRFKREVIKRR